MADIRVHIDTLEYTRQGLRTREPINLQVGAHNRVVFVRPERAPAFSTTYGGFAPDSTFPGPAVLSLLLHQHRLGSTEGSLPTAGSHKLQVFGHCDASGSEADNKALSERRADTMRAWLAGDVQAILSRASDDDWGTVEQQVMLRSLGCDPGPIDGTFGILTEAAVSRFQARYGDRAFHPETTTPLHPGLEVDGVLGAATSEALVDAYATKFSPRLDASHYLAANEAHGCAAFNAATADPNDAANRRVSLVVHPGDLPYPDAVPCTRGDANTCAIVGDHQLQCMWFREHVHGALETSALHHHFAGSWLRLTNDKVFLSALTTVPNGDPLTFVVRSADGAVLAELEGYVEHGVGQVVWDPPPDLPLPDRPGPGPATPPLFDVVHEPTSTKATQPWCLGGGAGTVVLHTDIEHEYAELAQVSFTLSEASGRYAATLRPETDGVSDRGYSALHFDFVPEDGIYTLRLTDHAGTEQLLFENVPFGEIERIGADDPDDIVDPFTLEPV